MPLFLFICVFWSFWLIRQERIILFYLYLWQLKEYHWGRFLDHFRTEKGKRLVFHPLKLVKLVILFLYWPAIYFNLPLVWLILLTTIYALESLLALKNLNDKTLKKPVFTLKSLLLTMIISGLFIIFLIYNFWIEIFLTSLVSGLALRPILVLLLADVLSPLLISIVVLTLQPLSVFYQLIMIAKATKKRQRFAGLIVIGVTGSYGKTSTKEFLATILSDKFKVLKTAEHQNSEIGIARCILNDLRPEHQIFICEMGAYNKGKIRQVANMAKPKIGIVCGVNQQHLSLFGSMEKLISGEGGKELLKSMPERGTAIFNDKSAIIHQQKQKLLEENPKLKVMFCSPETSLKDIGIEKDSLVFKIETTDFKVACAGQQNLENLALAIACAQELSLSLEQISQACKKISLEQGPIRLFKSKGGADIIDSTYSGNPNGVMASLEYLKLWTGKKILVMPCLIELGKAARQVHQEIGQKIAQNCDLAIITTKDYFKEIKEGAASQKVIFLEDKNKIIQELKPFLAPGNAILLEDRGPIKAIDL